MSHGNTPDGATAPGPIARIGRGLVWLEETIIAYLLATMTGVAFANFIVRQFFSGSLLWALELTLNLFLYLVMFGMAYVLRKGMHIGIDAVVNLFRPRMRKALTIASAVISLIYALAFVWVGLEIVDKFTSSEFLSTVGTEELDIPHWLTYSIMALCYAYLGITVFVAMIEIIAGRRDSITAGHEAEEDVAEAAALRDTD